MNIAFLMIAAAFTVWLAAPEKDKKPSGLNRPIDGEKHRP